MLFMTIWMLDTKCRHIDISRQFRVVCTGVPEAMKPDALAYFQAKLEN